MDYQLYYQPQGIWVGDIMPYGEDGTFYVYHQRDTRNPGPFGEPFGWALAKTDDFVHYDDFGESLKRGRDDEADQFIYAGSVFKADQCYHAFYTGYNREFLKAGKTSQTLLHAYSEDGVRWEKSEKALELAPEAGYDKRNWRDPFVVWNEDKEEYLLILGARKGEDKRQQTGRLVKFTSKDLEHWIFGGDFWAPGLYTMFEMPELFRMGEWWYLVYSEYSEGNKIHYRMSKQIDGPWIAPADDGFDGRAYYAGRTAFDGRRRVLFGWVPTRIDDEDKNTYLWGGTFVPHELYQREDGTLGVGPVTELWNAFTQWNKVEYPVLETVDAKKEYVVENEMGKITAWEADCSFEEGTRSFSIKFYEDSELGVAYEYQFHVAENRLRFDKSPNYPWYQCLNIGLERHILLNAGENYHIQFIVDRDIATLYVNGTALNARLGEQPGSRLSVTVTDGKLYIKNARISTEVMKREERHGL